MDYFAVTQLKEKGVNNLDNRMLQLLLKSANSQMPSLERRISLLKRSGMENDPLCLHLQHDREVLQHTIDTINKELAGRGLAASA